MSIAFHLDGAIQRDLFVAVDGRANVVDSVDDPTVSISADMRSFMMLACGRIDPQEEIDAGRISWTGDATWERKPHVIYVSLSSLIIHVVDFAISDNVKLWAYEIRILTN